MPLERCFKSLLNGIWVFFIETATPLSGSLNTTNSQKNYRDCVRLNILQVHSFPHISVWKVPFHQGLFKKVNKTVLIHSSRRAYISWRQRGWERFFRLKLSLPSQLGFPKAPSWVLSSLCTPVQLSQLCHPLTWLLRPQLCWWHPTDPVLSTIWDPGSSTNRLPVGLTSLSGWPTTWKWTSARLNFFSFQG